MDMVHMLMIQRSRSIKIAAITHGWFCGDSNGRVPSHPLRFAAIRQRQPLVALAFVAVKGASHAKVSAAIPH